MIIIGHSFGGAIVYNAISEYLIESLTEEQSGDAAASTGSVAPQRFGDMVVLLNPAFEAVRYTPLYRVASRRAYDHYQAPILVSITSTADQATGFWFKLGRQVNSVLERKRSEEERIANVNTPGHMEDYITHELSENAAPGDAPQSCADWVAEPHDAVAMGGNLQRELRAADEFLSKNSDLVPSGRPRLRPGWVRRFCGGMLLTHLPSAPNLRPPYNTHDANSPIWNVRTDESLIRNHDDIDGRRLFDLIRQLYHDTVVFPTIR